ncbi:poly(A) polymerase [Vitiosangium sp. GDMCC 1.1324]|uniref:poly(A) polymerase n=1 Tax=Vitiosangium sp. (strain GDMCC 1.1324) TaxID=2138576 RepID=UPI000D343C06|nr:poly(A) polymerase [Vitiosangium sp. GDMCC 1.1324]PTL78418.1 endonuclease [Vitiosangium sp. GDMCC 1.1324]
MSQDRFQTSREVYHRIRWDPRLDAHEFVIGYDARGERMEEVPFSAFVPDGEIPWHRVWYFRRGHQVVWDRRERIDLTSTLAVESSEAPAQPPPPPPPPPTETAPRFTPLPLYRYDARARDWVEVAQPASDTEALPSPAELTVATFNVLFDLYDPELLDTRRRTAATISLLRSVDADIIALQEVTEPFLRALLETRWVREHFFVSEGPAASTVTPYGQVLLSRFPFASLSQCVFSRDKRIIAGELALPGGALWVATLHLTSNRDPSGGGARAFQVQALIDWARSLGEGRESPDVALVGDFNFGDDAPELQHFERAGFIDAWAALRPGDAGYTYDPERNALAALTTTSGRRQRLDRVLVRSTSGRLVPHQVGLFAEAPLSGPPAPGGDALFASDHFGLSCVLRRGAEARPAPAPVPTRAAPRVYTAPLVRQSVLVLIPPEELWAPIQALRAVHDSKYERWMPHMTLLFPFVPEAHFGEAEALIAEAVRDIEPFEVTLSGFGYFEQSSSVTAWLRPEDRPHGALKALHAALEAVFPRGEVRDGETVHDFRPHLTVGQLPRAAAANTRRTLAGWERDWRPLRFEVRDVCLTSKRGDGPFEVRRRVPLGGDPRRSIPEKKDALRDVLSARGECQSDETRQVRQTVVGKLESLCARLGAELHPYGSYLLGTDSARSDVDAVAVGPASLSREDFAHALTRLLAEQEGSASARFVADAALPMVKLSLDGVSFDVSYARRPEGVEPSPPAELLARYGEQLDVPSFRALNGWTDTRALLDCVEREGAGPERFRTVLRAVRAWAKARGVYSHAQGYLGGLSWAVMVAWACTRAPREAMSSDGGLLAHFFETFAAWPWPKPVTLTADTANYQLGNRRDLMPVVAPTLPLRNSARNVSRSTLQVMRDELSRAREVVRRARAEGTVAAWDSLFEPADLESELPVRLVVSVEASSPEAHEAASGWVLGHLTALVYRMEADRRLFARPFPSAETGGPFVIGLSTRGPDGGDALSIRPGSALARTVDEFRASFQEWSHRPPGAALSIELVPR